MIDLQTIRPLEWEFHIVTYSHSRAARHHITKFQGASISNTEEGFEGRDLERVDTKHIGVDDPASGSEVRRLIIDQLRILGAIDGNA